MMNFVFQKITDALFIVTFCFAILSAMFNSVIFSISTGISLTLLGISAHNFLHRRNNWRMLYLNLTGLNYQEWRISHVLSHHMFPNTFHDLEVSNFEPLRVCWIPKERSEMQKLMSVVVSPFVWILLIKSTILKR